MRTPQEILQRKKEGIDCDADESAVVKSFFDTHPPDSAAAFEYAEHFGLESDDWWTEFFAGDRPNPGVFAYGGEDPHVATHWFHQIGHRWMAVGDGEDVGDWFRDTIKDGTLEIAKVIYPIGEVPPFGKLIYLDKDGNEFLIDVETYRLRVSRYKKLVRELGGQSEHERGDWPAPAAARRWVLVEQLKGKVSISTHETEEAAQAHHALRLWTIERLVDLDEHARTGPDTFFVDVRFERSRIDDLDSAKANFPGLDDEAALLNQFALELQGAFNEGMAGHWGTLMTTLSCELSTTAGYEKAMSVAHGVPVDRPASKRELLARFSALRDQLGDLAEMGIDTEQLAEKWHDATGVPATDEVIDLLIERLEGTPVNVWYPTGGGSMEIDADHVTDAITEAVQHVRRTHGATETTTVMVRLDEVLDGEEKFREQLAVLVGLTINQAATAAGFRPEVTKFTVQGVDYYPVTEYDDENRRIEESLAPFRSIPDQLLKVLVEYRVPVAQEG